MCSVYIFRWDEFIISQLIWCRKNPLLYSMADLNIYLWCFKIYKTNKVQVSYDTVNASPHLKKVLLVHFIGATIHLWSFIIASSCQWCSKLQCVLIFIVLIIFYVWTGVLIIFMMVIGYQHHPHCNIEYWFTTISLLVFTF